MDKEDFFDDMPELLEDAVDADVKLSDSRELSVYDPLQHYLMEVRRYPFLTREQEQELALHYYDYKDPKSASRLIVSNLRFVVGIAMKYKSTNIPLLDLIQEGNIGLMQAIKNFDPHKGVRVITYAGWWIKAAILKYIMKNWRLVKVGTTQNERRLFFRLQKEKGLLEAQGIEVDRKLLSERLNVKEIEVTDMENRFKNPDTSLDVPVGGAEGEGRETVGSMLPAHGPTSEEAFQVKQLSDIFRSRLKEFEKGLNERDRQILQSRILTSTPMKLRQLSEIMDISIERVRQLENKIINNLRSFMKSEIKDFDVLFTDIHRLDELDQ